MMLVGPNGSGRFSHSPSVEDMVTLIQETDDEFSSDSVPTAAATFPKLGHGMLKYFNFDDGYINTNNGPFPSCSLCLFQTEMTRALLPQ